MASGRTHGNPFAMLRNIQPHDALLRLLVVPGILPHLDALSGQLVFDMAADGLHMDVGLPADHHEEIGHVGEAHQRSGRGLSRRRDRICEGELAEQTPRAVRGAGEKSGGVGTTRELRLRCRVSGGRGEFDTRGA